MIELQVIDEPAGAEQQLGIFRAQNPGAKYRSSHWVNLPALRPYEPSGQHVPFAQHVPRTQNDRYLVVAAEYGSQLPASKSYSLQALASRTYSRMESLPERTVSG